MKKIARLGWKIYFLFFATATIWNLLFSLSPDSIIYVYYHVLMAFDKHYRTAYFLSMASGVMAAIGLIPLFLFIFQLRFLPPQLWAILFVVKVVADLTGHSYEVELIKSLFYSSFWLTLSSLAVSLAFSLPAYIIFFKYAFRRHKIIHR